jgi:hypothetical protein
VFLLSGCAPDGTTAASETRPSSTDEPPATEQTDGESTEDHDDEHVAVAPDHGLTPATTRLGATPDLGDPTPTVDAPADVYATLEMLGAPGSASPDGTSDTAPLPVDDPGRISTIPDPFRALMEETTWQPGCPVGIDELRTLTVRYVGFDGVEREGDLIVHHEVAADLLTAFAGLYEDRFPIERIEPIEHVDGDDDAAMAANLTTAFNCRPVTGGSRWSEHAYGWAVDINPIQNPYLRGEVVLPPEGSAFADRSDVRPGMLTRPGPVEHFDAIGWAWGGDWSTLEDHMHLSLTGR